MKFQFVRYNVDPTATIPAGEVRRPLIPVRIIGPTGSVQVLGLVDTGADNVYVSASLAKVLNFELTGETEAALGAGGHEIETWPGTVEIELTQGNESHRWRVVVAFLAGDDDPPIVYLGHAGFLEHFHAYFDTREWSIELIHHNDSSIPT